MLEEETVAGQKIYRTPDGWFIDGLISSAFDRDTAAVLAELLVESRTLALINARIAELGGTPIPPRRVSDRHVLPPPWPHSAKPPP